MQNGLFILEFDKINAGFIDGYLFINNIIAPNTSLRAVLNNKTFQTNSDGYFSFGFPEGEQGFIINESDTALIEILPHDNNTIDIYINNEDLFGDINQDNIINILDAIIAINIILNTYVPTENELWLADINHDNIINIQDIILIIQMILET